MKIYHEMSKHGSLSRLYLLSTGKPGTEKVEGEIKMKWRGQKVRNWLLTNTPDQMQQ